MGQSWVQDVSGTGGTEVWSNVAVATDNFGHVYSTGTVETGTVSIGTYTLPVGAFIIKSDAATGNIIWVKSGYNTHADSSFYGGPILTDADGNLYFAGLFSTSITFDTFTLNTSGNNSFLVKFDTAGHVMWAKQSSANTSAITYDIAADNM
jgi:hypothetical protein